MTNLVICFTYRYYDKYKFNPIHIKADLFNIINFLLTRLDKNITVITDLKPNLNILNRCRNLSLKDININNVVELTYLYTNFITIDKEFISLLPNDNNLFFYYSGHSYKNRLLIPTRDGLKTFDPNKWLINISNPLTILDCCKSKDIIKFGNVICGTNKNEDGRFMEFGSIFTYILLKYLNRYSIDEVIKLVNRDMNLYCKIMKIDKQTMSYI